MLEGFDVCWLCDRVSDWGMEDDGGKSGAAPCWEATIVDALVPELVRFIDAPECLEARPPASVSASSPSWFRLAEPPTPTASRNRLYSPLNPCWTKSPADPLFSIVDAGMGGGAKSLKVVRESARLAAVWILSNAWVSCSFLRVELTEAMELRRLRKLMGDPRGSEASEAFDLLVGESLAMPVAVWGARVPVSHGCRRLGCSSGSLGESGAGRRRPMATMLSCCSARATKLGS